jgi:hypothetical protein
MKFQKLGPKLYYAAAKQAGVHYRIDGREMEGYRVDTMRPLVPVWEAIDGGKPVQTLKQAKALIAEYRRF